MAAKEQAATTQRLTAELSLCRGCKGHCAKESNRYFRPKMCTDGAIVMAPCRQGADFTGYERTSDNVVAMAIADWYILKKPPRSLYFYGGVGTGKTRLARIIATHFSDCIFDTVEGMLGEIKASFTRNGISPTKRYCQCELLVMDDMGAGASTDWSASVIHEIINSRYEKSKRTIITSNYSLDELRQYFSFRGDAFTGARIVSRLSEMCEVGYLGEEDYRRRGQ